MDEYYEKIKADLQRPDEPQSREWLEEMLAYAVNLLSQASDQIEGDCAPTTGPCEDPDRYTIGEFVREVRKHYPRF